MFGEIGHPKVVVGVTGPVNSVSVHGGHVSGHEIGSRARHMLYNCIHLVVDTGAIWLDPDGDLARFEHAGVVLQRQKFFERDPSVFKVNFSVPAKHADWISASKQGEVNQLRF